MAAFRRERCGPTSDATSLPPQILHHALAADFPTGLVIAGLVVLSGFFVALFAMRTPGRWRLRSTVNEGTIPYDEALGACAAAPVMEV